MVHQQRNIAFALAQRRKENRDNIDAEIEILAEASLAHAVFQVIVCRRDQAKINFSGAAAAEPLHGAFLQDAQQLALQGRIERCDLVQKKRAIVRQFNEPRLGSIGPGERAFLIAEEFGLHQTLRKRRAIEAHERLIGAIAALHDGVGDKLLAYATLPAQDHGRTGGSHGFNGLINLLHGRHCRRPARRRLPCSRPARTSRRPSNSNARFSMARERTIVNSSKRIGKEEEFVGAGLAGFQREGALIGTREGDNHHIVANTADFRQDFQTVDGTVSDAIEIKQNGVEVCLLQDLPDGIFICSQRGAEFAAKMLAKFREDFFVIGDDGKGIARRAGSRFGQVCRPLRWAGIIGEATAGSKAK